MVELDTDALEDEEIHSRCEDPGNRDHIRRT